MIQQQCVSASDCVGCCSIYFTAIYTPNDLATCQQTCQLPPPTPPLSPNYCSVTEGDFNNCNTCCLSQVTSTSYQLPPNWQNGCQYFCAEALLTPGYCSTVTDCTGCCNSGMAFGWSGDIITNCINNCVSTPPAVRILCTDCPTTNSNPDCIDCCSNCIGDSGQPCIKTCPFLM